MTTDAFIFVVEKTGERIVVGFHDWGTSAEAFYRSGAEGVVSAVRNQLESLIARHECKVLAIDMTPVDPMPSAFLGLLISLRKGGMKIELLHPSGTVRESLDTTKLLRFFTIRD
jgi:anti-anti-sigma factor